MTTHYTIHSPVTGRTLKLSYRGGKFYRMEQLAGKKFTASEMPNIGLAVPATMEEIPEYAIRLPALQYTKIEKTASIYQQYVGAWHGFYEKEMGYAPKFTGMDGKALNQIKTYLTKISGSDTEGLALFATVLESWHKLEEFHRQNTDLKYINTRLNVILNAVKKAGQAGTGGTNNSVSL